MVVFCPRSTTRSAAVAVGFGPRVKHAPRVSSPNQRHAFDRRLRRKRPPPIKRPPRTRKRAASPAPVRYCSSTQCILDRLLLLLPEGPGMSPARNSAANPPPPAVPSTASPTPSESDVAESVMSEGSSLNGADATEPEAEASPPAPEEPSKKSTNFDIVLDHFSRISQPYTKPHHTRRVTYPAWCPCLLDADWCLQFDWCLQSGVLPD